VRRPPRRGHLLAAVVSVNLFLFALPQQKVDGNVVPDLVRLRIEL
jgi:hypothetical protein